MDRAPRYRPRPAVLDAVQLLRFLPLRFAGLVHREQARAIAVLREENRVLKEHLRGKVRFADGQRRRLATTRRAARRYRRAA